jgi:hypothetical protein
MLTRNVDGKLRLDIKQTLADQQGSTVAGSNYDTAISSKNADGGADNGYAAYHFVGVSSSYSSNILESTLQCAYRPIQDTSNRISFQFQDKENRYARDSLAIVDTEDVSRVGQELTRTLSVNGIQSYDQGKRIAASELAESFRGNRYGDTRGTLQISFQTTVKAAHLRQGQIVCFTDDRYGLDKQLFRVTKIQAHRNAETYSVAMLWHNDDWYVDTYGQGPDPDYSRPKRDREARPPWGWQPYSEQPETFDPMFDDEEWTFGLGQIYTAAADATALARLKITGKLPVNMWSDNTQPPFVPLQGTTASTGGSIAGDQSIYVMIAAKDSGGKYTPPSNPCKIDVPSGTSTNTVTVPNIVWQTGSTGYAVYAGPNPNKLALQSESGTTPSSITLTAIKPVTAGPPDSEFDRIRFQWKEVRHSGPWGAQIASVTSTTITIAGATFDVNEFQNYDISVLAIYNSEAALEVLNFTVASNTSDTLTVSSGDPSALGLKLGDVVVARSKSTVSVSGDDHVLTDAEWVNCFGPTGLDTDAEKGMICRIISGTGAGQFRRIKSNTSTAITIDGQFEVAPDSTSRFIVEEPNWRGHFETTPQNVSDPTAEVSFQFPCENLLNTVALVQAVAVDGGGAQSFQEDSPVREIYLFGGALTGGPANEGYNEETSPGATYTPDFADGFTHELTLGQNITINVPVHTGGNILPGHRLYFVFKQDATGGRTITFNANYDLRPGFDYNTDASAETHVKFVLRPDGVTWKQLYSYFDL